MTDTRTQCPNCGADGGGHFMPPSFGEEGFYMCKADTRTPEKTCLACDGSGHWTEEVDVGVGVLHGCHCTGRPLEEIMKSGCCTACGGTGKVTDGDN